MDSSVFEDYEMRLVAVGAMLGALALALIAGLVWLAMHIQIVWK